ncbi:MAG: guanylate kinase [Candidatus Magasanikbacteria bacterium CG11_big_fil_rev_8_21_14_0_20_39_34]|uniref:Guanylate kinase n=1 Tax=Candidatus Magasanikbacteria bacterium CG11_big_fil_rev_8_21_14_0_20_39_34 TaxID=1974653 RepID=A0A2H0N851_9BACT|nr:MAG: guanylate kinase [Candidatus Magasanikbacteria bacterium CG11_big_fil_rev_8_21_14_0_20_39_34]
MAGKLVVISAPSGGGKNAVIARLIPHIGGSCRLVTTTTRDKRAREKEGIDYFFVSKSEFQSLIESGALLEHNLYAGEYYGIQKKHLQKFLEGHTVVFSTIDVHGKQNLDKLGIEHISIFLMPEDVDILEKRIRERGSTSEDKIEDRLKIAEFELNMAEKYDYIVVNRQGFIEDTVQEILAILDKN